MNTACRVAVVVAWIALGPLGAAAAPDRFQTLKLTVGGVSRSALLYVPAPMPATAPARAASPLVFVFHGHGGTSRGAARSFRTDQLWPEAISVYPQGLDTVGLLTDPAGDRPGWQHAIGSEGDRDLHFFDALLARVRADHAVDDRRVFCAGHSNGGGFTYLLWRARPDAFAAFAVSSAAAGFAPQLAPKPAILLGGRDDPLVLFDWQRRTMESVRRVDGCEAIGAAWGTGATLYPSRTGTPVVTYVHAGGHPMDAAEPAMIVRFFREHPAPTARP